MCHSSDSHISTDKIGADCAMNDDKNTHTHGYTGTEKNATEKEQHVTQQHQREKTR